MSGNRESEASAAPGVERLAELERRWNEHPGIRRMGVRLDLASEPGSVRAVVDPIESHHRGGMGTPAVNGPTIAAVFDLLTGLTGYLQSQGKRAGVAQLNIHFLRPVLGDRFDAVARVRRAGRTLVFVAAELTDSAGTLCAQSDGIVVITEADATGELAL